MHGSGSATIQALTAWCDTGCQAYQTRTRESASTARKAWSRTSSHLSLLSLSTCCSFCRSMPSASASSASFLNSPTAPQLQLVSSGSLWCHGIGLLIAGHEPCCACRHTCSTVLAVACRSKKRARSSWQRPARQLPDRLGLAAHFLSCSVAERQESGWRSRALPFPCNLQAASMAHACITLLAISFPRAHACVHCPWSHARWSKLHACQEPARSTSQSRTQSLCTLITHVQPCFPHPAVCLHARSLHTPGARLNHDACAPLVMQLQGTSMCRPIWRAALLRSCTFFTVSLPICSSLDTWSTTLGTATLPAVRVLLVATCIS